jgi:transcriptional regulator with PAS, ATPase and Fis domain
MHSNNAVDPKAVVDTASHYKQIVLSGGRIPGKALTRLVDCLPGMVYRCRIVEDYNYILDFVNKRSRDILGIFPEQVIRSRRNSIERMMHPQDMVRVREEMRAALKAGQPYKIIYRLTLTSGESKWILDQGEAIATRGDGIPTHIGGILVDISDQKNREIELLEENERLRAASEEVFGLGPLVGRSEGMQKVYGLIQKAAACDTGVIIYGETGTGKELVASTIHSMSKRKGRLIPVNCGAIPEQLLESEFFGYRKGAFSGANREHMGFIAAADGGCLFLDEVGEISTSLQIKLLRVLESRQYTPLGSSTPRHSDFRIIAATNRDLLELVRENRIRTDFYYRINVLPIHIPPLRERREDINLLIDAFLQHQPGLNGNFKRMPMSLRLTMNHYDWPGNVRELLHCIERYTVFGDASLPDLQMTAAEDAGSGYKDRLPQVNGLHEAKLHLEREMILNALEQSHWRRGRAARQLGLSVRTLQRKMKMHGFGSSG